MFYIPVWKGPNIGEFLWPHCMLLASSLLVDSRPVQWQTTQHQCLSHISAAISLISHFVASVSPSLAAESEIRDNIREFVLCICFAFTRCRDVVDNFCRSWQHRKTPSISCCLHGERNPHLTARLTSHELTSFHLTWVYCESTQFTSAATNQNKVGRTLVWLLTATVNWVTSQCS